MSTTHTRRDFIGKTGRAALGAGLAGITARNVIGGERESRGGRYWMREGREPPI